MSFEDNNFHINQCIDIQLDFLKKEIDIIQAIIARIDTITQATKNWAIVTWTASVGLTVAEKISTKICAAYSDFAYRFLDHRRHLATATKTFYI